MRAPAWEDGDQSIQEQACMPTPAHTQHVTSRGAHTHTHTQTINLPHTHTEDIKTLVKKHINHTDYHYSANCVHKCQGDRGNGVTGGGRGSSGTLPGKGVCKQSLGRGRPQTPFLGLCSGSTEREVPRLSLPQPILTASLQYQPQAHYLTPRRAGKGAMAGAEVGAGEQWSVA